VTTGVEQRSSDAPLHFRQVSWRRRLPGIAVRVAIALAASWVLVFARGTPAGPAIRDPARFLVTLLDGVTSGGLLFVVASGFTLIFGLMRTVNMAHGSLFLLAAFVAIRLQQTMVGRTRNIEPVDVGLVDWFVPLLAGAAIACNSVLIATLGGLLDRAPVIQRVISFREIVPAIGVNLLVAVAAVAVYRAEGLIATAVVLAGVVGFAYVASHDFILSCPQIY
jgi:branched-chain amino acid transport system permease protein